MEIKGTVIEVFPKYILSKFGQENFNIWLDALSDSAKKVYSKEVLVSTWFPYKEILVQPTIKFCELFCNNDYRAAADIGSYSAEKTLSGIYSIFVKLGSPEFIIKKTSLILPTYYRPSAMEIVELKDNRSIVRITQFEDMHQVVEYRIIGWIRKALEISGAKNLRIDIPKSLVQKAPCTEIILTWE